MLSYRCFIGLNLLYHVYPFEWLCPPAHPIYAPSPMYLDNTILTYQISFYLLKITKWLNTMCSVGLEIDGEVIREFSALFRKVTDMN